MTKKAQNSNMHKARKVKNDEFYTQLTDIEQELLHYRDKFKGKVIYCNCDDPVESEFYRYFHLNFHFFGMKKLLSTHYDKNKPTYALVYQGGTGEESDNDYNSYDQKIPLKEDGDFRSQESINLLKQADMVVTNPPFSLFKEYITQLIKYHKQFIIIGNKNAIVYKEVFPLLVKNKIWLGINSPKEFRTPNGMTKKVNGLTRWFTNVPLKKPTDREILWKHFNQEDFPVYDNYSAFECSKVAHIPVDNEIDVWLNKDRLQDFKHTYLDLKIKSERENKVLVHIKRPIFGVPITFLDKYNPSSTAFPDDNLAMRFEIIGGATGNSYRNYPDLLQFLSYHPAETKKSGGCGVINGKTKYARILIRPRNSV